MVEALHREVEGRYETAHGLSGGFVVDRGTGQGCHNGPARAKLTLAPAQRAVTAECAGYKIREGPGGRITQLYFADDACFLAGSIADVQAMFDLNWFLAKISGLTIKVKRAEKTAYMACSTGGGKYIIWRGHLSDYPTAH